MLNPRLGARVGGYSFHSIGLSPNIHCQLAWRTTTVFPDKAERSAQLWQNSALAPAVAVDPGAETCQNGPGSPAPAQGRCWRIFFLPDHGRGCVRKQGGTQPSLPHLETEPHGRRPRISDIRRRVGSPQVPAASAAFGRGLASGPRSTRPRSPAPSLHLKPSCRVLCLRTPDA